MTELLYMTNSYLKEFEAVVVGIKENCVILDRTAFYPKGGGQLSDRGKLTIDDEVFHVLEVFKDGDDVLHRVDHTPPLGVKVKGELDWSLRYVYMRHHSALHVLSGVVYKLYEALVTGEQIHADRARLDFDLERLDEERVKAIEDYGNRVVKEARPIVIRFLPHEEAVKIPALIRTKINLIPPSVTMIRVVEIEGFDEQADGGTHVADTGEIGRIRIVKTVNKGRINKRIEIKFQ